MPNNFFVPHVYVLSLLRINETFTKIAIHIFQPMIFYAINKILIHSYAYKQSRATNIANTD